MTSGDEHEPDDARLLARVAGGDEAAFMTLYDRHADALYGTAVRFLRDRESAAEVLQDVFVAIWQRAAQYDPRFGSGFGWLVGIARNRAIDRLRADARRPRAVYAWTGDPNAPDGVDLLDRIDRRHGRSGDGDPAEEMDRHWLRSLVRATLAEMPPDERQVVVLAYDGALTQSEIAVRLGLPIGTVKSRTRRALARLRARLGDIPGLRSGPDEDPAARSGSIDDAERPSTAVREIDR